MFYQCILCALIKYVIIIIVSVGYININSPFIIDIY